MDDRENKKPSEENMESEVKPVVDAGSIFGASRSSEPRKIPEDIDREVNKKRLDIIASSEKEYGEITKRIIEITDKHLQTLINDKKPIRKDAAKFIKCFLITQLVILFVFVFLNSLKWFEIKDTIITAYIVSAFAETLSGLFAIIHFAFDNKQEIQLIGVLNKIVKRFQKFEDKKGNG